MKTLARDEASIRAALQAGMRHHDAGRLAEAEAIYREVLAASPGRPDAMALLADLGQRAGRLDEALRLVDAALAARPDIAPFHDKRGLVLAELARFDEALAAFGRAVTLDARPAFRVHFARCLAHARCDASDAGLRALVARALREAWIRPADLARPAIALVQSDPAVAAATDTALRAWPESVPVARLFGAAGLARLSGDALLAALLENAQVCDANLERFLTVARRALLDAAHEPQAARALEPAALGFACALARQCFLNDYVFGCSAEETQAAQRLAERIAGDARVPALSIALVALYQPLHRLRNAEALAAQPWPAPVAALFVQQLAEPAIERELRATIPRLGIASDEVSLRVQRQYEENPYPRWTRLPAAEPVSLEAYLRRLFPHAAIASPVPDREILIAGCGTGQESIDLARCFASSRVLAIDLSLASLGYAARKAREAGVTNLEHAHADILALEGLDRRFDAISSVGVLHHLRDPLEGWRRLVALLQPGGYMQVGLYSEAGRRDLAAARRLIAEHGYRPTPDGIRTCRRELLDSGNFPRLALLRDLYGMNECRDLLFHEQEHRFTLPQVAACIDTLGLEFVGMVVEPALSRRFAERFPADRAQQDVAHWHAFEGEFPDAFAGMYLFWVRKPAA